MTAPAVVGQQTAGQQQRDWSGSAGLQQHYIKDAAITEAERNRVELIA
jgi:hypothetical protein